MTIFKDDHFLSEASAAQTKTASYQYCDTRNSAERPYGKIHFFMSIIAVILLIYGFVFYQYKVIFILFTAIFLLLTIIQSVKFIIFMIAFFSSPSPDQNNHFKKNTNLPIYSIIVPIYQETDILPSLLTALDNIDYPKHKLQIIFATEADDTQTICKLMQIILDRNIKNISIINVPYQLPRTKPKALNVVLPSIKGKYFVVYDAEDRPDRLQLKKAVYDFKNAKANVIALQARLTFFNHNRNLITKLFTLEYDSWFHIYLQGLQKIGFPIPLSGTSTHFRTDLIKKMGGWDAFNVTEDCDLGMRFAKKGYDVKMLDSDTFEESPIYINQWICQRTRWLKGYLQSFFVHSGSIKDILDFGFYKFFGFLFVVAGQYLSAFLHPLFLGLFILSFFISPTYYDYFYPMNFKPFLIISLTLGTFLPIFQACLIYKRLAVKRSLIFYSCLHPLYWLFAALASYRALWQLICNPFYWEKTKHGIDINHSEMVGKQ